MEMNLGYKIVTFLFDTIWAPRGAHRIEWHVPHACTPLDGERILRKFGVKVWSRQWTTDPDGSIDTASVLVAPGQRAWAEECLFVAHGYEPAGDVLDRTDRRKATAKPYTPKRRWAKQPVASKTVVSGIMGILDKIGG